MSLMATAAGGAALTLYGDGIDMMIQWYDGERIVIGNGIDMMITLAWGAAST
jgi:hypothetical protein